MSNTPSDAEIWDLIPDEWTMTVRHASGAKTLVLCNVEDFARAVLAKWGTPQPVVREPLTQEQVSEIADAAHRECDRLVSSGQCAPRWSAVFAYLLERAHGITQQGGD